MSSAGPEPDLSVQSFQLKITRGAIVGFMSVFQKFKIILDGHNTNVNRAVNQTHETGGGDSNADRPCLFMTGELCVAGLCPCSKAYTSTND